MLGLYSCVEPLDEFGLVFGTRHRKDDPVLNLDQGMRRIVRGETAIGTRQSAGRSMMEKVSRVLRCQSTDRRKLLEVVVTAEDRDRQLVQEEK
ncbi:hypothetical protein C496_14461 [Natronorubrum tibetense GA33]|uniref:Uncharacterized protein n=1 Tax=Natronorubrum tibetense GA33 TaxID=1114856 RepID=L9VUE3_9EURY|nr:hypothetical protein C496_14461 [Natronorubrum tibetense GA33]